MGTQYSRSHNLDGIYWHSAPSPPGKAPSIGVRAPPSSWGALVPLMVGTWGEAPGAQKHHLGTKQSKWGPPGQRLWPPHPRTQVRAP